MQNTNWLNAYCLVCKSPLSLSDDPADGGDEFLWSQWDDELWTVNERWKWTGNKSDSESSDVEIKAKHLYGCHSSQPLLSPFLFFSQLLSPSPFLLLSVWVINCSTSHLGFGILSNPTTSQTHRPLCCFLLFMFPDCPNFLPSHSPYLLLAPAP